MSPLANWCRRCSRLWTKCDLSDVECRSHALTSDERPARGGWAPGSYMSVCAECNRPYSGGKRTTVCAACEYAKPTNPNSILPDEALDRLGAAVVSKATGSPYWDEGLRPAEYHFVERIVDAMRKIAREPPT